MKAGSAQGKVKELGVEISTEFVGEPVPYFRQFADQIIFQPGEAMQLGARCALNEFRREDTVGRMLAVPQHHARPVLSGIVFVLGPKVLFGHTCLVVVLYHHHRPGRVAKFPQPGDVIAQQHVAIHEDSPAAVFHQVRHQETAVDEVVTAVGMFFHIKAQIVQSQRI